MNLPHQSKFGHTTGLRTLPVLPACAPEAIQARVFPRKMRFLYSLSHLCPHRRGNRTLGYLIPRPVTRLTFHQRFTVCRSKCRAVAFRQMRCPGRLAVAVLRFSKPLSQRGGDFISFACPQEKKPKEKAPCTGQSETPGRRCGRIPLRRPPKPRTAETPTLSTGNCKKLGAGPFAG